MKASELKAGDKVKYHDTPATVLRVRANGVTVQYWMRDEQKTERVAARYLVAA